MKISAHRMAEFRIVYDMARKQDQRTARQRGFLELYIELRERITARGARRALRIKKGK